MHEVKMVLKLDHPNVVKPLCVSSALTGMILPWFKDGSLNQTDFFSPLEIKLIGLQLFGVVKYLHQAGYYYYDMKLENVVRNGQEIVLIDFGLSQSDQIPVSKRGTPTWMSPGMLNSDESERRRDPSVDYWPIGLLLYMLNTDEYNSAEAFEKHRAAIDSLGTGPESLQIREDLGPEFVDFFTMFFSIRKNSDALDYVKLITHPFLFEVLGGIIRPWYHYSFSSMFPCSSAEAPSVIFKAETMACKEMSYRCLRSMKGLHQLNDSVERIRNCVALFPDNVYLSMSPRVANSFFQARMNSFQRYLSFSIDALHEISLDRVPLPTLNQFSRLFMKLPLSTITPHFPKIWNNSSASYVRESACHLIDSFENVTTDMIIVIKRNCLKRIPKEAFRTLTDSHIDEFPAELFIFVSDEQYAEIPEENMDSLDWPGICKESWRLYPDVADFLKKKCDYSRAL